MGGLSVPMAFHSNGAAIKAELGPLSGPIATMGAAPGNPIANIGQTAENMAQLTTQAVPQLLTVAVETGAGAALVNTATTGSPTGNNQKKNPSTMGGPNMSMGPKPPGMNS